MVAIYPPVVFPDAVATIIGYLTPRLGGVPVHRQVPNPRPAKWLRILRTGGVRATPVTDAAQITLEAWADRHSDAADLAQLARAHLNASLGVISRLVEELGGPTDLPDPESHQHRYTWTALVHLKGAPL